ncbi:MAG: EAL domain-containing protein [Holosporaceae bacterium]|jgi:EAL domain-containing protein (putative c-di-GMP-specific phosphodiesterase class I)|nr:EAL domain-containing protein [Holosporaceae bacterium]
MINKIRLQPLVCLSDETIFGYEVLYRRENTSTDYPSALDIFKSVTSFCKYENDFRLFINMTANDIIDLNFCKSFRNILNEKEIEGSNIVLEVSESTSPDCLSQAKKTLSLLRGCNVKIALDDFGTEYASLSFLKELPIDIVKIDKNFVQEAPSNKKSRALLKFCTQISHDIGCEVVVEGIETPDQLDCVRNSGADIGQGFLFAPPTQSSRKKITPFIELGEITSFPVCAMQKAAYCGYSSPTFAA